MDLILTFSIKDAQHTDTRRKH